MVFSQQQERSWKSRSSFLGAVLCLSVLAFSCNSSGPSGDSGPDPAVCGNEIGNGMEIVSGPSGPAGSDYDSAFRSLTVHPTNPDIILIGTERNGFVKSEDGGATWTRLRAGLRHLSGGPSDLYPEIWDIAFDPADPTVIYAATLDSPGPVTGNYPSSIAGVYKSTDSGATWSRSNCGLPNSRITSVQVSPDSTATVLIGVEGGAASFSDPPNPYFDGGIYRSMDGGANWTKASTGDANDVKNGYWRIVSFGSPSAFMTFGFNYTNTAENAGFLKSTDGGATWTAFGSLLRTLLITGWDISTSGQTIHANPRDSFKIQTSADGGSTWSELSSQANGPVAISPADPQIVLFAGMSTLYRSDDGLGTSSAVLPAGGTITDIVFAPSNPSIVYVITNGYLLYKSVDSGATFSLAKNIRSDVLNDIP